MAASSSAKSKWGVAGQQKEKQGREGNGQPREEDKVQRGDEPLHQERMQVSSREGRFPGEGMGVGVGE